MSYHIDERHPLYGWVTARMLARDGSPVLDNPQAVYEAVMPALYPPDGSGLEKERFVIVALDRTHRMVDMKVMTVGNDASTVVCAKQVYRWALTRDRVVTSVVMAHNHPSGDSTPSYQDKEVTLWLRKAGRLLGIELQDSLVCTERDFVSLRERGLRG